MAFKSEELYDYLAAFDAGVNSGVDPALLQHNQLADARNITVRGTLVTSRPQYRKIDLTFLGESTKIGVENGLWQGGCFYKPDTGSEIIAASISGRLYRFTPADTTAIVDDITGTNAQDPDVTQSWLWQAERWIIWNDGINYPVFFDGNTTVRSNNPPTPISFLAPQPGQPPPAYFGFFLYFTAPAVGATTVVYLPDNYAGIVGDILTFQDTPSYTMQVMAIGANQITIKNLTLPPSHNFINPDNVPAFPLLRNFTPGNQLPPGRMGTYGLGRNWFSLPDERGFMASDIVGGSSGTAANNFRDAVLSITENTYLNGGGNFTVPSSGGTIKSMIFTANLDASLGQGPLQVHTGDRVFSCNAPVERVNWQNITNPILTESLINSGGISDSGTVLSNSDTLFRAQDGIRSLILARREFGTWGNVPISREVQPTLDQDNPALLGYAGATVFDNRSLFTARPAQGPRGVYHPLLIALNQDPISSLRGKAPSVYDGVLKGLNVLKLIRGTFSGVERLFAFHHNTDTDKIELWEILPSASLETVEAIEWTMESADLDFGQTDPRQRDFKRLMNGEIFIDELVGQVRFQAFYKPNQWPNWVPWHSWIIAADPTTDPGYRPRLGLGEPSVSDVDNVNNTPLREALDFQFKLTITELTPESHVRFRGARFKSVTIPVPEFAPPA